MGTTLTGASAVALDTPPADSPAERLLAEAARRLTGCLNQRRCLRMVAELAVTYLAHAAVVVGPPDRAGATRIGLVAGGRPEEHQPQEWDPRDLPALDEALMVYPPQPSQRLDPAVVPDRWWPDGAGPLGDLILMALPGSAGPGGALLLARRPDQGRFPAGHEDLLWTFAQVAGAAISAATLYREQADAMAVLQADLLPTRLPEIEGVELVGSYQPAEHGLLASGDFFEVFPPAGRATRTLFVLGDVCGKGARAAALTGKVRHTLRALHLVGQRPAGLLTALNESLLQPGQEGRFVTLVVGSINSPREGQLRLTFATGGHPPPLVLRHGGTVETVPVTGALVGVLPELGIRTAAAGMARGDLCLLYSDGMIEARGGATGREEFGERRLRRALASCDGMPAEATLERLRQIISDWVGGGTKDDIAMLAIRAHGGGKS
jgi:serine phosphatase RsbU (regulator of sigma subunit)